MNAAIASKNNQSLVLILEYIPLILECRGGKKMTNVDFSLNFYLFYFALVYPKTEVKSEKD